MIYHWPCGYFLPTFFGWVQNKVSKGAKHSPANGILYLKGGDYCEELKTSGLHPAKIWNLDKILPEAELGEKYLIHFKNLGIPDLKQSIRNVRRCLSHRNTSVQ